MSLPRFQALLLRTYTDKDFRAQLAENSAVLADEDLTEHERKTLTTLPFEKVESFHNSLRGKRWGMFRKNSKRLMNAGTAFISSFYISSPALFVDGEMTGAVPFPLELLVLLKHLESREALITPKTLLESYLDIPSASPASLFKAVLFSYRNGIIGKKPRIL